VEQERVAVGSGAVWGSGDSVFFAVPREHIRSLKHTHSHRSPLEPTPLVNRSYLEEPWGLAEKHLKVPARNTGKSAIPTRQ